MTTTMALFDRRDPAGLMSPLSCSSSESSDSLTLLDEQKEKLHSLLDVFVNEDEGDVPIFESSNVSLSLKDSHHGRVRRQTKVWQGSCRSFTGLDFSDHSSCSLFNVKEKPDRQLRRSIKMHGSLLHQSSNILTSISSLAEEDNSPDSQGPRNKKYEDASTSKLSAIIGIPFAEDGPNGFTKDSRRTLPPRRISKRFEKKSFQKKDPLQSKSCHGSSFATKRCDFRDSISSHQPKPPTRKKTLDAEEFQNSLAEGHQISEFKRKESCVHKPDTKQARRLSDPIKALHLDEGFLNSVSSLSCFSFDDDDSTFCSGDDEFYEQSSSSFPSPTKTLLSPRRKLLRNKQFDIQTRKLDDAAPKLPSRIKSPSHRRLFIDSSILGDV